MFDRILIANRGEIACRVMRDGAPARGLDGGGLFRRRRAARCTWRWPTRRCASGRRRRRRAICAASAIIAAALATGRAGDPSGLRLPVGEPGVRRGGDGGRARLHRAVGERDPGDGAEGRGQGADGRGRGAGGAGLSRRRAGRRLPRRAGGGDRLSGADQGGRRRRRQGHAAGRRGRAISRRRWPRRAARRGRPSATTRC